MSVLKVAKFLYLSRSIDLSQEKDRYFNVSMANTGRLFSCLNAERSQRVASPACMRTSDTGFASQLKR